MDGSQHAALDNLENVDQGKREKEPRLHDKELHVLPACEGMFNLREVSASQR